MTDRKEYSWGSQLAGAAVFAAIGLGLLYWFVTFAESEGRTHREPFRADYSEAPLLASLTPGRFVAQVKAIDAVGTRPGERERGRADGSPGFYRTEALILDAFREAGLVVTTQEFEVTVPVTEYCELLDETGRPLEGVELYPFMPAGLQPVVMPKQGLRGKLVATESMDLNNLRGNTPSNSIVVTYLDDSARNWRSLAAVGVQAVIVREDEVARRLRLSPDASAPWGSMVLRNYEGEVGFPRFLARGPIEQWTGKPVTVRCKVAWQTRKVRNVIGILRGEQSRQEALILEASYDSNSLVPELAPGAEQSLSLAALLEYARAMAPYRGRLRRDIVFVATPNVYALGGTTRLLEAIETFSRQQPDYRTFEERRREQEETRAYALRALDIVEELARDTALPADQRAAAFTRDRWMGEEPTFRKWFERNFAVVTGEIDLENQERTLAAKLAHLRAGSPVYRDGFDSSPGRSTDEERKAVANTHPLLATYLQARQEVNRSANLMATPLWKALDGADFTTWACADKARIRFRELAAYHEQQIKELDDLIAVRGLLKSYERTLTIHLQLTSGGEKRKKNLAVLVGIGSLGTIVEPQVSELANAMIGKVPRVGDKPAWEVVSWGSRDASGSPDRQNRALGGALASKAWHYCGRQAFTVGNYEFSPKKMSTPEDTLDGVALDVLSEQVPSLGRALLAVGFGQVPFKTIQETKGIIASVHGTVYTSAGAASLVPTHPVTVRTFVQPYWSEQGANFSIQGEGGVVMLPVVAANPYGGYERRLVLGLQRNSSFGVNAARFDGDGRISFFKDSSDALNRIYRNQNVPGLDVQAGCAYAPKPINVPVFRCEPVALYDVGNPSTLKSFKRSEYLSRTGLAGPSRFYHTLGSVAKNVDFMEPDFRFYVGFMDGAPGNAEILENRAFMLNVDPAAAIPGGEPEVFGRGYLVADTPNLAMPHLDAAASMLRTDEKRLTLLQRYGMADEQMIAFHVRAKEWLADARAKLAAKEPAQAVTAAFTSLAYAINNHPVIRSRVSQAVVGILWYLGLLVPFVFFAEKLIFGFSDIRRQLLASGIIFVLVFVLLQWFHPAFQIVRSSLVILLGFIIFLLTVLVTLMVGGKFQQNIKELRRREGRVEGADINRAGVVGTAFMLGLNNMRRRKVRTGLTCVTLILITFVMICFTSVSTDLKNVEYPTGRSEWNGIMLRKPNYTRIEDSEFDSINRIYGSRFPITTWQWIVPSMSVWTVDKIANPQIQVDREFMVGDIPSTRRVTFNGCIGMQWNETMFSGIDRYLLTTNGWFPRPPQTRAEKLDAVAKGCKEKNYIILPDTAAAELGLTPEDVNTRHPTVTIVGSADPYEVLGILDSEKMARTLGLDGRSIMPYDINSVQAMGKKEVDGKVNVVAPEDIGRLSPRQVMIVNRMPTVQSDKGDGEISVACLILFPKTPYRLSSTSQELAPVDYKEQRRTVLEYLERLSEPAYYAIDGVAYYGSRQRAKTIAGLLELLVPILIAALTVFNTMRGSVYERKDEIYVYNAVGVAPNHVFFIFMAEACVYAVVGALMGYLLSQGTGRLLTALGMTGGLNMDYSSIETIYASLAIMMATLLSTVLPARDAARMASPANTVSWTLPEAQGDVMQFNLPFTFIAHDRVAVVSYFHRWLDANGAGSSGPFYCSTPEGFIRDEASGPQGSEAVPVLSSIVWLKPYDLGVSQRVDIALPTDPETGEYIARITITRLSGHVTTWRRHVKSFLVTLRKQFLNWRVTTQADRTEMFAEAKRLLQAVPTEAEKET